MLDSEEKIWSTLEWDCNIAQCGKSDTFQMHHMSRCPGVQYWNNLKLIAAGVSMVIEKNETKKTKQKKRNNTGLSYCFINVSLCHQGFDVCV